jgi:uncharacterized protein YdhG (YjbR/CyaY superfamily)
MSSAQADIDRYITDLPAARRDEVAGLRAWIRETLPEAEEVWTYSMPGIAKDELIASYKSQKNYISLYMDVDVVADHKKELDAAGLDCGKSCIRFTRLEQLPESTIKAMLRETMARQAAA